ncbi:hypothetical protein ACFQO1_00865 [Jejudonia soesokkakensis]|uniref:Uncharacterized protein n=1 Tax=Jejudonia soesokkakensis TaxID=1323432 RepID=A0ABW2MRT5_9FLAO
MKKEIQEKIKALATQLLAESTTETTSNLKNRVAALYENLSVLAYLESQIEPSETFSEQTISKDSKSYREANWFVEPEPVPRPEHKEELVEPLMEKIKDLVAQMPEESQQMDALLEEILPKKKYIKNDLEEFAANYQQTPTFERKASPSSPPILSEREPAKSKDMPKKSDDLVGETISQPDRPRSINDSVQKGLKIGLNDRLAFVKHLFDGKTEDYTRVLSQIDTMNSWEEAATFIKGKVKPDYNYWMGKEEYSERFMNLVEKSFS